MKDRRKRVGDIAAALFVLNQAASLASPASITPAAPSDVGYRPQIV